MGIFVALGQVGVLVSGGETGIPPLSGNDVAVGQPSRFTASPFQGCVRMCTYVCAVRNNSRRSSVTHGLQLATVNVCF